MTTIYLKSPDEKTVVSIRGKNPEPDESYLVKGYVQIDPNEFRRIKRRILTHPTAKIMQGVDEPKHSVEICPFCDEEWDPNDKPKSLYDPD